ncbi:MAG: hypothetical protein FWC34_10700 [Bacteroidetes bacterium]|nr:hypothetical protein [Bacteroidota bacterium]MCL2302753.1 hypothetical protein [Lentimicrobiaceae bacterium]
MNNLKTVVLILVSFLFLFSCGKDKLEIKDGTYKGVFTVTYGSEKSIGETKVTLNNGKYKCSGNFNRVPAGGSGKYSIENGKIKFQDENFWTTDFDWNLILNGEYDYTFDGKKLKISATKNDVGRYEYDLEKN